MKKEDIIFKALKDENFKKKLLENPAKAIEDEWDVKFNENIKFNIIEEAEDEILITIPYLSSPEALSDETLVQISGGGTATTCTFC